MNHPEKHYLKIAILWEAVASAVVSLNDLKIQLRPICSTEMFYPFKKYEKCIFVWLEELQEWSKSGISFNDT